MNIVAIKKHLNEIGSRNNHIRLELIEKGNADNDRIWADCAQIIANAQAIQAEVSLFKTVPKAEEGAPSHD